MRRSFIVFLAIMFFVLSLTAMNSYSADNTSTVNYANQPPPSAISAGVQSYSQMICSFPVVAAVQTSVLGFKVASISILCAGSKEIWSAMLHSGTPCSIWDGKKALIGKEAIKYYKIMRYIDNHGQILRYPDYLGGDYNVSNYSDSNGKGNGNLKRPK